MPKSGKSSLSAQDSRPPSDSVYDFLYQDTRRVGSYLAQLSPTGHTQSVKQTLASEETGGANAQIGASGGVVVASTSGTFAAQFGSVNRDILERSFDPLWRNAIELLELLTERSLIHRDISSAKIGQFVLFSGTLGLLDFSLLKLVWDTPELRSLLEQGIVAGSAKPGQTSQERKAAAAQSKVLVKCLIAMPKAIQMRVADGESKLVYATVQEDGLVSTATEMFLKHGLVIPGEWAMLGILDAHPGEWLSDDVEIANSLEIHSSGPLPLLLNASQGLMREAGRPKAAFGITPLLVFRKTA